MALAFLQSGIFVGEPRANWGLFTTPDTLRPQFQDGTKFLVAIGGWGDPTDVGFDVAALDDGSRKLWSQNVAKMVKDLDADGVDIDWEYPGCVSLHPAFHHFTPR